MVISHVPCLACTPNSPSLRIYTEKNRLFFFANLGYLTGPDWTKTEGITFSHSDQTRKIAAVDAFGEYGDSGVLGRLRDTLIKAGHKTSAITVSRTSLVLEGESGYSSGPVAVGQEGLSKFPEWISLQEDPDFMSQVGFLNNATEPDSGFMAEAWSDSIHKTISIMDELSVLQGVSAITTFPNFNELGDQLKLVSRLQQTALQRGVTRDLYSVSYGSWDHHGGVLGPQETMFQQVDDALAAYTAEAKAIGVWDSTVIVQVSEFGRTLYPNGNDGSEHGWGGHYFAIGGGLNGGKVLGKYPENLWEVMKAWGRRPVPSLPWDSVWNGVAEWAGTSNEDMTKVCPNRGSFEECDLFDAATLFGIHGMASAE